MTILIVSSLTDSCTANYFIEAFEELNREIFVISDKPSKNTNFLAKSLVDVKLIIRKFKLSVDFLFFIEGGSMRILPDVFGEFSFPTAWYAIDSHMDIDKHKSLAKIFDYTFVAQKEYIKFFTEENVLWLPLAFPSKRIVKNFRDKTIDISSVGSLNRNVHPTRYLIKENLEKKFSNTKIIETNPDEMFEIYQSSFIVLNKSINNDINMRYFEGLGSVAILLTNRIFDNGIEDIFDENAHIFYYDNESEINEMCELILNDENLIKKCMQNKTNIHKNHTYINRCEMLLDVICKDTSHKPVNAIDMLNSCLKLNIISGSIKFLKILLGNINYGRKSKILVSILGITMTFISQICRVFE